MQGKTKAADASASEADGAQSATQTQSETETETTSSPEVAASDAPTGEPTGAELPPGDVVDEVVGETARTTEDDYQHFLAYSGLAHSDALRYAYYHGADDDGAPAPRPDRDLTGDELLAKANVNGPRVTHAKLADEVVSAFYFTPMDAARGLGMDSYLPSNTPMARLTFCVLVLKNGFTVTGQSACVSPENYREEVGKVYAREDAERKLWPLLGFRLADRIANQLPLD